MKKTFTGYYRPTKEEFAELWKNCIFVFDASVLLDLYRSTAKTRDVLLSILEKIKDRIWLPHQAAWEYQDNRLNVIAEERELYSELRKTLDGLVKSVQQKMHNHAVESAERIKEEIEGSVKNIIAIIDKGATEHPDLIASDHIREKITQLFEDKVGQKLDEKRLARIYQEGLKRYEQKIPPGYKDTEKGGTRQFGDLVVWNEILEQARAAKRPVIFVTSDTKEDWWWKQGQFTVGPRPELVQEMAAFAETKFYMYNLERFLSEAQKHFDTKVGATEVKKAADEFKDIESKRKIELEITPEVAQDLAYLAEQQRLLLDRVASTSAVSLARLVRKQRLSSRPASEAMLMSPEEWARAIEDVSGRTLPPAQAAILQDSIKRGVIANFAKRAKTLEDVASTLSIFLQLSSGPGQNK